MLLTFLSLTNLSLYHIWELASNLLPAFADPQTDCFYTRRIVHLQYAPYRHLDSYINILIHIHIGFAKASRPILLFADDTPCLPLRNRIESGLSLSDFIHLRTPSCLRPISLGKSQVPDNI